MAFAQRLRRRGPIWIAVAALSAAVMVIALEMLIGDLTPGSFVTAGAVGVGVALGFGLGERIGARGLASRARAALDAAEVDNPGE
jgi:hypothetical protein